MKSLRTRAMLHGLCILLGLLSALPNVLPNVLPERVAPLLPAWFQENRVQLGLDLRGGSQLLLAVDSEALFTADHLQLADTLGDSLRDARIHFHPPLVNADGIRVKPRDAAQLDAMAAAVKPLLNSEYQVRRDDGELVVRPSPQYREQTLRIALERSLEVIRKRLDETGLTEPSVTRQGEDAVLVQLPGVDSPARVRDLLGTTAQMTFHWVADERSAATTAVRELPGEREGDIVGIEQPVALEGRHIRDAQLGFNQDTQQPVVNFRLDREGGQRFAELTRDNIGRQLAVVLDGRVVTAPVIRSLIGGGSGEISGSFSAEEASNLALMLRSGALPAPLLVMEERTVGPELGSDAIAMGLHTGLLGTLLVFAVMVAIYGRWGLIACAGLGVNITLVFGVLSLFGATLTLPGIAGLILSIGMAVDANILINERIREEARRRGARLALDIGFRRAFGTILDSNITTLIAVSLLFLFGSGPVRGFAVTMAIGLVVSMYTAISLTRLIMEWRVARLGDRPLVIAGISALDREGREPFAILRGRFVGVALSLLLCLGSASLLFSQGLNHGIDFSGGTLVEVEAPRASVEDLRRVLQDERFAQAAIQESGDGGHFMVRLPAQPGGVSATELDAVGALKTVIASAVADATFPRAEMVGPKVSGDFADATLLALLLAGLGMWCYLWARFELHFAVAAMATVSLDLIVTIGFFVVSGIEFNLTAVAALLALMGYSVNDKVVIFDRIRESLRSAPTKPLMQAMNESICATLGRTVFTSLTTLVALLPMGIAGGAAVASFALPMLFGIVVGTGSSIFLASPLLYWLGLRRVAKGQAQLRPSREEFQRSVAALP